MADLSDDQLDRIEFDNEAAPASHRDVVVLVAEVRRLRAERDRLRDGIHNVSGWLVREADEGLSVEPDTVLLMLGALLDGQEGDRG